jgi:thiamine-phosphate pyrophosphorylase
MKLIVMTKATFFVEEDKILTTLFEAGLDNLHLYKPESEPIYSERLMTLLPESTYNKITVHDHFYLKEEFKLKGIHINNHSTEPPVGYRGNISRTCHLIEELRDDKRRSNYVFLKTIFDSQSNSADKSTHTIAELTEAARRGLIDKKVYAFGGINLDNISVAKELGFGGVVICGDLWNRFDIHRENDFKELISHFEKLRKAVS